MEIYRSTAAATALMAMTASVPTLAQAEDAGRTLNDNEAIFIDGKTLTVTPGRSKDDVVPQVDGLNVHALGPGAIVFRSGDKLYIIAGMSMGGAMTMNNPGVDRQRSYGGFYDSGAEWRRQQSYGGLNDPGYVNYRLKQMFGTVWSSDN